MLTVKTYLAPSNVHGIGLYASEDIPARSVIWKFNDFIDRVVGENEFLSVCRNADFCTLQHLLNSSYKRDGKYYYLTDNARFINHSDSFFNVAFLDDFTEIALRDIRAHEEMLENYFLSYDMGDYFFAELSDPDPLHYLHSLELQGACNAHS